MGTPTYTEIGASDALKFFKSRPITVQEARPAKGKDDAGKARTGFDTKDAPLSESHVLSAKAWSDGRITITTIDGRRHEAKGSIAAADSAAGDKK